MRLRFSFPKDAGGEQVIDFLCGNAPVDERGARSGARRPRRRRNAGGRALEARGGARLHDAVDFDERAAGDVVRMKRRFRHGEDRREAGVGSFEQRAPVVPRAGLEQDFEFLLERRPVVGRVSEAEPLEQHPAEFVLDRRDGDEAAVRAFVRVVDRRAGIEQIFAPLQAVQPGGVKAIKQRHQRRGALGHGGVDDLAPAGALSLDHGAGHAEGEVERAAAEIRGEVERRGRLRPGAADGGERARQREIIEIMAGRRARADRFGPSR